MILAISEGRRPWAIRVAIWYRFLSQLLITHGDTSSTLARSSVPLPTVGFLPPTIHKCRTYYLNSRHHSNLQGMWLFMATNFEVVRLISSTGIEVESISNQTMSLLLTAPSLFFSSFSSRLFPALRRTCLMPLNLTGPVLPSGISRSWARAALRQLYSAADAFFSGNF